MTKSTPLVIPTLDVSDNDNLTRVHFTMEYIVI